MTNFARRCCFSYSFYALPKVILCHPGLEGQNDFIGYHKNWSQLFFEKNDHACHMHLCTSTDQIWHTYIHRCLACFLFKVHLVHVIMAISCGLQVSSVLRIQNSCKLFFLHLYTTYVCAMQSSTVTHWWIPCALLAIKKGREVCGHLL
jgi:hypothetical protein